MVSQSNKERGQILILVVVGIVGLLGFTALAIDGGLILSQRRFLQSVADAAAMAGAGTIAQDFYSTPPVTTLNFSCASVDTALAATDSSARAVDNQEYYGRYDFDLTLDGDLSDGQGVDVNCDPTAKLVTVRVLITQPVQTAFTHLFFKGEIKNTVESETEVTPLTDLGQGNTIVALHMTCETNNRVGVTFTGNSNVIIDKGGVWSNACINDEGASLNVDIKGSLTYSPAYPFTPRYNSLGELTVQADTSGTYVEPIEKRPIEPPDCGDESLVQNGGSITANGLTTIYPGNYTGIRVQNKDDTLVIKPGLYCLTGDFSATSGSVVAPGGVTIYMMKDGNHDTNFTVGGNAGSPTPNPDLGTIQLIAPALTCKEPICGPAVPGLLVYMHMDQEDPTKSNEGNITLQGNESSVFTGTIYAPEGSVDLGGASNTTTSMGVQVIADTVKIHGTINMDVKTTADHVLLVPASLTQSR